MATKAARQGTAKQAAARRAGDAKGAKGAKGAKSQPRDRAKRKISVTVDADLWDEVSRLVQKDAADTASAAVETALAMWAANQRLRELLDEVYRDTPGAAPDEAQVAAAAELLSLP